MVETAVVLLAVIGAIVFVMRMDEDPNRWRRSRAGPRSGGAEPDDAGSPSPARHDAPRTDSAGNRPAASPVD